MDIITEMFTTPTAHHLCDSGGIYGRSYETNKARDFSSEPQALLKTTDYGLEVTVSTWHHMQACLERNSICAAFDTMDDGGDWNSDYYGTTQQQQDFLEAIGADVGEAWNSYNWENNFDQVLQGHRVEINGDQYTLLQVHGGCDVRSGYTAARLFKIQAWMEDYWCSDDVSFCIPRAAMEEAGYPEVPGEYDYICVDFTGFYGHALIYDPNLEDESPHSFDWDKLPSGLRIEGTQRAVEH
jgi:hypothetical protein